MTSRRLPSALSLFLHSRLWRRQRIVSLPTSIFKKPVELSKGRSAKCLAMRLLVSMRGASKTRRAHANNSSRTGQLIRLPTNRFACSHRYINPATPNGSHAPKGKGTLEKCGRNGSPAHSPDTSRQSRGDRGRSDKILCPIVQHGVDGAMISAIACALY